MKPGIASAWRGAPDHGQRWRGGSFKTGQHLVVLELGDQAVVPGTAGILVQEPMKVRRGLEGAQRGPQRNHQRDRSKTATVARRF